MSDSTDNLKRIALALEEIVNIISEREIESTIAKDPNKAELSEDALAVIIGNLSGMTYMLQQILDEPTLNTFQKHQELRKLVKRGESMIDKYQGELNAKRLPDGPQGSDGGTRSSGGSVLASDSEN